MSENVCDRYFDTTKGVVLQVDSSQVGLGAVLLQDGKPVKMRYTNIEREMLVIVFGYLKYHYYQYGRRVVCKSDHQSKDYTRCTKQTTKGIAYNTTI